MKPPLVQCAHKARPAEEMTPERVADVLLEEEAGLHWVTSVEGLLERLQTPEAKQAMEAAFNATPEELGRAAVKEAQRRR